MNLKQVAGDKAAEFIEDGMVLGLGTGSTVYYTILRIGELVRRGYTLTGIPTSRATEELARSLNIPLGTIDEYPVIDLTIDGADEVDPELNLIKGMGGALVREKIVAASSRREIIVVDESKVVRQLGTRSPLPVEVVPFGSRFVFDRLSVLGGQPELRLADGAPFVTDNGNNIIDATFQQITDAKALEKSINNLPGVVENGLFLGMADMVIVGREDGPEIMEK